MKLNMKEMMKQAQQMQTDMAKKQEELAAKTFEAASGGGMVTVVVNGRHELISLTIDPSIVSSDDVEMLQDLITAAVNEGFRKVSEAVQQEMSGMMGGLGGLGNLFGA